MITNQENEMSNEQKPNDNRTATQKITDLENAMGALYQTADNMARDLTTAKDAIKLLGNKLDAVVKASAAGEPLNDTVISRIMIENNCAELAEKVNALVVQGILVKEEQVGENAFVIGAEIADDGAVINPRLQFALKALSPALQEKIIGSRAGDLLTLEEGKLKFKVSETYSIQNPQQPAAETPAEAAAPAAEVSADAGTPPAESPQA